RSVTRCRQCCAATRARLARSNTLIRRPGYPLIRRSGDVSRRLDLAAIEPRDIERSVGGRMQRVEVVRAELFVIRNRGGFAPRLAAILRENHAQSSKRKTIALDHLGYDVKRRQCPVRRIGDLGW